MKAKKKIKHTTSDLRETKKKKTLEENKAFARVPNPSLPAAGGAARAACTHTRAHTSTHTLPMSDPPPNPPPPRRRRPLPVALELRVCEVAGLVAPSGAVSVTVRE